MKETLAAEMARKRAELRKEKTQMHDLENEEGFDMDDEAELTGKKMFHAVKFEFVGRLSFFGMRMKKRNLCTYFFLPDQTDTDEEDEMEEEEPDDEEDVAIEKEEKEVIYRLAGIVSLLLAPEQVHTGSSWKRL